MIRLLASNFHIRLLPGISTQGVSLGLCFAFSEVRHPADELCAKAVEGPTPG